MDHVKKAILAMISIHIPFHTLISKFLGLISSNVHALCLISDIHSYGHMCPTIENNFNISTFTVSGIPLSYYHLPLFYLKIHSFKIPS
jgi:hypothetical protein